MSFLAFVPIIGKLFEQAGEAIDRNITSDDERLQAKGELHKSHANILNMVFTMEGKYLDAQSAAIKSEMEHGTWLTRSWRPIVMLCFMGFVIWFGIGTAFNIPVPADAFIESAMGLIKIGMGGYILGRSGEKIAVNVVGALKKKEQI